MRCHFCALSGGKLSVIHVQPCGPTEIRWILVIGVTGLVAVDVNSGRATKEVSIEETALKTNLEAAEEGASNAPA